jgi:GMP synthase (glutamine-hydrolysing)
MNSNFDPDRYIQERIEIFKKIDDVVLVAVSGGVDSTTSATLIKKAHVESKLLHIDTGFQREGETDQVLSTLSDVGLEAELLRASDRFFSELEGINDSYQKRETFRRVYFEILETYLHSHDIEYLVQGTQRHRITGRNAHNNPTTEFLAQDFKVIEPLRNLTKYQIRQIAKRLELPDEIIYRRPFPGPGLLLRFGGRYTPEKLEKIRRATYIVDSYVDTEKDVFDSCYQIFPYLVDGSPVVYKPRRKEGGLGELILIRSVEFPQMIDDGKKYSIFLPPLEKQEELVYRLMEIEGVARICWDMTPKYEISNRQESCGALEYI